MTRLDHVGIPVRDLERSKKFYCELLGFEEYCSVDMDLPIMSGVVFLKRDDLMIEFHVTRGDVWGEKPAGRQWGIIHLAFLVDDIEKEFDRFRAAGYVNTTPLGYSSEIKGTEEYRRYVYFAGPDGELIELRGK